MTSKFITTILVLWLTLLTALGINNTGTSLVKPADNTQFQPTENWELVFEDNFDADKIDTKKWHYGYDEEGVRRGGYWVDDAVFVEDGNLTIRTNYRKDGKFGEGWYSGAIETSKSTYNSEDESAIDGFEGFSGKYGYYEIRCKVPEAIGIWAAFWLMPDSNFKNDEFGTGKDGAEIDIFESPYLVAETYKQSVAHAVHIDGYGEELKSSGSDKQFVRGLYDKFHTFALEWTETEYIFYVDGMETWRNSKTVKEADRDANGNPYDTVAQVMEYMILSVEVGGEKIDGVVSPGKVLDENKQVVTHWSGDASVNDTEENYDFVVDYVKVYQKKA